MSKIIIFDKYFVNEMNYQVKEIDIDDDVNQEEVEFQNKYKIGVRKSLEHAFVEMDTDISTKISEQDFRILNLRVRFFFNVNLNEKVNETNISEYSTKIADDLKEYGVSICEAQIKDIIRQITSIGYNPPIIL